MRDNRDQDYLEEFTYDADQGGSDFIDSLPAPEIKTTEDLIAVAAPAAPKPTDAMLRGEEMSQTQFEGMEPVYQSYEMATRGDPGILLGYKYGMNQIQEPGMTASYSAPVYDGGRAGERQLVDPGGKFLGYQYTGIIDVPKSAEILAIEKQLGKEVNPYYATYSQGRGEFEIPEPIGPPIGYSYDNGKSQIVSLNTAGEHQSTVNRGGDNSGFFNSVLSMLSLAYPPIAPFIQAYRVIEAIDKGDTLGVILNAAGAGTKIPGLDASTVKLLNEVKTGAAVIQAVKTGDPLKILSATANIRGVDPDLKDVGIVLSTAKALKDGNITGAFNGISKMSDRDSVGRLTERFDDIVNNQDVANLNLSQIAAFNPDEPIDDTLTNSGLVSSDVIDKTPEEQEQEDREQAAREAIRASEKTIEDTLIDSGLVSTDSSVDTLAQEQADREQAAREAIRAQEKAAQLAQEQADAKIEQEKHDAQVAQDAQDAEDRQEAIDKATAEAKEASDKADADAKAAKDKEAVDKAAADKVIADKAIADAEAAQKLHDEQVAKDEQDAKDRQEAIDKAAQEQADREQAARETARESERAIEAAQAAKEQEDREQAAREAVRESERAIEAAQLAQEQADREQTDFETKRVAQADREQAARDAIKTSERTIEDTLIDAGLVLPTDVQELDKVEVTEKAITDNELFLDTFAQEKADREQAARDAIRVSEKTIEDTLIDAGLVLPTGAQELDKVEVSGKALTDIDLPITGDQGRNRVTDSSVPVNPNVGTTTPTLERKEVSGKREIDTDLPITSDTGSNRVTDSYVPVNPNAGEPLQKLKEQIVTGKRIAEDDLPITSNTGSNRITDSNLPVDPNAGKPLQEFKPVTVTGKRDQELEPVTIIEKRIVDEEPTPDGGELKPVTIIGKKETPVIPKLPVIPKVPATPAKPAPAKPAPKKPTTPAEQLYQTTTQSNPTTLADIKYYLDMASGGMVPPKNPSDPLESLLNQPMSVEELLYHLRS